MSVGFIGLGNMGLPMATNLSRAGIPLVVWNRSPEKCAGLAATGAEVAETVDALFDHSAIVLLMLLDRHAIDAVLGRHTTAFADRVRGQTIVHLGTTSPGFSSELDADIRAAGGFYVEAPVSGSRVPAEQGQLVGMVAGDEDAVTRLLPLLDPLCARVFRCGPVPGALRMKLAANHYLIGTVAVLAETIHAERRAGVDVEVLRQVLDAGPMASAVSRAKLTKLVQGDFAPQAAIRDVATITELVLEQCHDSGGSSPLIARCAGLFRSADSNGHGEEDMAAVVFSFDPEDT